MSRGEIGRKLLSSAAKIDSRKIYSKYVTDTELKALKQTGQAIKRFPFLVNDNPYLDTFQIVSRATRWKYKNEIPDGKGLVVVDFLQLIEMERKRGDSEATAIKKVAYDLARMAKQLRCPVIALAQLNNSAEGEPPCLRFLEGSGGIAQAAECILLVDLVHRRIGHTDHSWPKDFNVIVAAQRTGESGIRVDCKADLRYGHFAETTKGASRG